MTSAMIADPVATCLSCSKQVKARLAKDGSVKLPPRWRRIAGDLVCKDCAAAAYYTRAIRAEITGLIEGEERTIKEFRQACAAAAKASARFGNWYLQRLYAADTACGPLPVGKDGKVRLPKMPVVDYYRAAVQAFPELSGGGISGLAQAVQRFYGECRFGSLVAMNRSVESYRWGYLPIHIRKQDWSLRQDPNGHTYVQCSITPGPSWKVSVFADTHNLGRLKQLQTGDAIPLAAKIVRGAKRLRDGTIIRSWFFRISAMFPRPAEARKKSQKAITMRLGRDAGSLLWGSIPGETEDVFEWPGVELRKLVIGGDIADRRRQQEQSMQRGIFSRRKQARLGRDRTDACAKRQRKINEQINLCVASLVRWAKSHGVTHVEYDATDRGFLPHFAWRRLRDKIVCGLEPHGIVLQEIDTSALAGPGGETNGEV